MQNTAHQGDRENGADLYVELSVSHLQLKEKSRSCEERMKKLDIKLVANCDRLARSISQLVAAN